MKYAFLFLVLSLASISSSYAEPEAPVLPTPARNIESFSDSQALITISEFMTDNAEDMPSSNRISDKKLRLKDTSECTSVNASAVVKEVESAIRKVMRLYPDEDLPVDEALSDLSSYLENKTYKKCMIDQSNKQMKMNTVYFFDSSDKKHVKVDTITLLNQ